MNFKIIKTNLNTKNDILKIISQKAVKDNFAFSEKKLLNSLILREKQKSTGFQDGIAIPHARIKTILKPIIYIIRNKKNVDWESLDGKKINVAIAILLPNTKDVGEIHMNILSKISKLLINSKNLKLFKFGIVKDIKKALNLKPKINKSKTWKTIKTNKTKESKVAKINILKKSKAIKINETKKQYDFVAITSCPTGVAHTNMAAESFEKFAKEKKLHIKVEKQGAQGTINKITSEDIKNAKMIIIASDKQIEEKDRFENKKIFEVSVANPIKNANKVFKDALKESKIYKISQRKKTLKQAFSSGGAKPMQALMNGVSYMIPFVIVGGILIAVSLGLGGTVVKGEGLKVTKGSFWEALLGVGVVGFNLMIPILAGFIASAIAGRSALAPAMIIGFLIGNQDGQLFNWDELMFGSFEQSAKLGFIGAIAAGFSVGYMVKTWNTFLSPKFPKVIKPIEPIIVIPLLMVLINWILFAFFIYVPLFYISFGLEKGVQELLDRDLFFIAALFLGAMIAFDMGGPINKIAFLIAGGLITKGKPEVMGAVAAAISVPPLGTGLAVFIGNKMFRLNYDQEDKSNAMSAIFMSMIGITEGAIPFAVKYPKQVIFSNVLGGAIGAAFASLFKITDNAQHGGPIVYLLGAVGKDGVTDYAWGLFFIIAIIVGALITAFSMNILLKISQKRNPIKNVKKN